MFKNRYHREWITKCDERLKRLGHNTSKLLELSAKLVCLATAMACAFGASQPVYAQSSDRTVAAKLHVSALRTDKTSYSEGFGTSTGHEKRDEVYIRVIGRDAKRLGINVRLPSGDDYYTSREGALAVASNLGTWRNQNDFALSYPELWEGELALGDRAGFLVMFMEQDGTVGSAAEILNLVFKGCELVAGAYGEADDNKVAKGVKEGCKHAGDMVKSLPAGETHDLLGAFYVMLENVNGELQTTYLPATSEPVSGVSASTRISGLSEGASGISYLEGELVNDEVIFEMIDNNLAGRYSAVVRSETIERKDQYGYHVINNDDLEQGHCSNGKPVEVKLSDGSAPSFSVGDAKLYRGEHIDGVYYTCNGSNEPEGNLFDKRYDRYIVWRTKGRVKYSPLSFVEYAPDVDLTRTRATLANFDLPNGARKMELKIPKTKKEPLNFHHSPVVPLIGFYNPHRKDHFLSSDPRWAKDPRNRGIEGANVRFPKTKSGYTERRFEGLVFNPKKPRPASTVPLFSLWNPSRTDNFTTSDPRYSVNLRSIRWHGEHLRNQRKVSGYSVYRLEGYVFDPKRPQPRGTIPLYSFWNGHNLDNFSTTDPRLGMPPRWVRWNGHHISNGPKRFGYTLYRLEGYVIDPTYAFNGGWKSIAKQKSRWPH